MASRKKAAVKKKAVAKKPVKALTKVKELTGLQIAMKQSLKDPKLWGTEWPGITIDHFIPKKTASKWVKNFNRRKTPIAKGAFMQPSNIDKQIFLDLLRRPEVVSLRFYFGLNEHNKVQVIFVGADAKHNDVYVISKDVDVKSINNLPQAKTTAANTTQSTTGGEEGGIDMSQGCPAYGSGETVMLPA